MKKTLFILALLPFSVAHAYDFTDQAQVVAVEPIFQQQQRCWDEQVPAAQGGNNGGSSLNAGTMIGAVAGGILGNQVGGGNGKTAATAVGAVTGALVGNNLNSNGAGGTQTVRRCAQNPQVSSYRVTYIYAGRQYTTQMSRNPGPSVRVGVGVVE